ncbi:DUF357 domain-containing protein [Methanoplanus limicola]|uniref:DUF357 domain-containing protein n=1 Tax=Methanoplanus limicola DSM 2279 TaxID=937775 RepID=H1YWB9_9EURY|nr:DUF357 domain-containing protein [Methanoplanus limicola]EHQ34841.1 protein of unknown function DUF357 [Methanoplanus limicola DSM 2279]
MNPDSLGNFLEEKIISSRVAAVKGSYAERTALECKNMAESYLCDGRTFSRSGDDVNAAASFTYALGWLDAGRFIGFIEVDEKYFNESGDEIFITPGLDEHLNEKTGRYERMLTSALDSVKSGPDAESPMYKASEEIIRKAEYHLNSGEGFLNRNMTVNALAEYSYGYGWLDCGVRAGIIIILKNRGLFTV